MANVKVAVRVRPLSKKEEEHDATNIVKINGDNGLSITNLKVAGPESAGDKHRERVKHFSFDHCYYSVDKTQPNYASQEMIFQDLGTEVLNSSFDGYNVCLFAYGQTGSGKTYTMMGNPHELGVIPRICDGLCSRVDDFEDGITFKIEVSYLEIYNERVRDLLADPEDIKYTLKVREHPKEGPYVQDLSKHFVSDYAMVKMLLNKGNTHRTTAATHMHDASSRSHAIFTLHFIQAKLENGMPSEIVSKINLVDLAGSERAKYNFSKDRLQEGANINKSLVTLGNCISALAENSMRLTASNSVESLMSEDGEFSSSSPRTSTKKSAFIPYRNSILTWLLKDSIGGNAKTIMIATISPASCNFNESMSTLRYARRAKRIINHAVINEDPNVRLIRELRSEIDRLKQLLNSASLSSSQASLVQDNTISRMLQENEQKIDQLTEAWVDKWREAARIMQECNVGIRRESVGVIVESELPHLIGMDDDLLSTGIILYHIKEGKTTIGRSDADTEQDIVLWGPGIEQKHAVVCSKFGNVVLSPVNGALCAVNGMDIQGPTTLTQGAVILLGKTNMFRFNHPAEAAKLREKRAPRRRNSITLRVPNNLTSLSEEGKRRCSISLGSDGSLLLDNDSATTTDNEDLRPTSFSAMSSSVSPIMMFNPGLELERQQKIEADKLDHTRKRLKELQEKHRQAEEAHEEREKKMKEAYQEHQKMIQEQKDVLATLIKEQEVAKQQAEKELEEMRNKLKDEKEQGKRHLEEELSHLREDLTKRAQMLATDSPNFPKIVAKETDQNIAELSMLDVDRKRLAQMELLQRQSQKKAEAALERRIATYDRQERAAKCIIEQEERRLHEIESIPNFENRFDHTGNDGDVFVCENGEADGERAAVIGWGRVSPIGGRSDSDSSSCKGSSTGKKTSSAVREKQKPSANKPACGKQEIKSNSKGQRSIKNDQKSAAVNEPRTPKQDYRTSVRSAEKGPGRSRKTEETRKLKSLSPLSKKPASNASRSPSPQKPSGYNVFSRLYPQQKPKFDYLRSKRSQPGDEYECTRERMKDQPPELIRRDLSRTENLPPINLSRKRDSRQTSPKRRGNTKGGDVSAKAQTPKADLIRRPVSRSSQPLVTGTAKYPRAKLEHRPRSISPRGPPKCKPERPSHSVPANCHLDTATVKAREPTSSMPRPRGKSPLKPANVGNSSGKKNTSNKRGSNDTSKPKMPVKKSKSPEVKSSSAPSSPSRRRKWERPAKLPDFAKVDILFFARKTENGEAFFVGLNPDTAASPTSLKTRPRSRTHPLKADDAADFENQRRRPRTKTHPLGADEVAELTDPVNVHDHPVERLPAVGCSKSMEDMMNLKTSTAPQSSPESSEMYEDSLDGSLGSDVDLDSLDGEPSTKHPKTRQSAIPVVCPLDPSTQSVSPSDAINPSFHGNPKQGNINPIPNFVQCRTSTEENKLPFALKPMESENDIVIVQLNPLTKESEPSRDSLPNEAELRGANLPNDSDNNSNDANTDIECMDQNLNEEPEVSDMNMFENDLPERTDDYGGDVQIISDIFLEKAPIDLESIHVVVDDVTESSQELDNDLFNEEPSLNTPYNKENTLVIDGPNQTVIDCYLEHHPVIPSDVTETLSLPSIPLQGLEFKEDKLPPDTIPEFTPKKDEEVQEDPVREAAKTTAILSVDIESPDSYTVSEIREIKSRPIENKADDSTPVPEGNIQMQLTAEIYSPDSWTINEVKEIKSRPEEADVDTSASVPKECENNRPEIVDAVDVNGLSGIEKPKMSVNNNREPEIESSNKDPSSVDDGTFSQSSSDELQEGPQPTNQDPSNSKPLVGDDDQNDVTASKHENSKDEPAILIRRDSKPNQDANRESGVVLTSSGEDWSDSESSNDSCDSGDYTVRRIDGLPEPLEVLEEETLLPGEFSDESSDVPYNQGKPSESTSANIEPEPSSEKSTLLGPELRRNMIPDGSDNGVLMSEPDPNYQVCSIINTDNCNNKISDIIEKETTNTIVNDLRELSKKLEASLAGNPDRIIKAAPSDIISPENHNCLNEKEQIPDIEKDSSDTQDRFSPPGKLHKASSDESLDYDSAEEDSTVNHSADGEKPVTSSLLPTPLTNLDLENQTRSTPIKSPDKTNTEIINEMVDYLPSHSEEIVDDNNQINRENSQNNITELPIEVQTLVALTPDFKDIFDSIMEDRPKDDDTEEEMNKLPENSAEDKLAHMEPEYIDENAKISSELQQLQVDVNHVSSMIEKYVLPTKDGLPSSAMLSAKPNNQSGKTGFDSPRSVTSQLSPIPEEFLAQSNFALPASEKIKEPEQSIKRVDIVINAGSSSESDDDAEAEPEYGTVPVSISSQLSYSGACYEDEEDSLFIPKASPQVSRETRQSNRWQPEPLVVKEELRPFLGKDFMATKAKMSLLLKVIGGRSGVDTSSESTSSESPIKSASPNRETSPETLSTESEESVINKLCMSLPIHLASYADEPLITKQAVMLEEIPIKWPEMPDPDEPALDIVTVTSTLNHKIKEIIIPQPEHIHSADTTDLDMPLEDWLKECPIAEPIVNRSAVILEENPIKWPDRGYETKDAETQEPDVYKYQPICDDFKAGEKSDDEITDILFSGNYRLETIPGDMSGTKASIGTNTSPRNGPITYNIPTKCDVAVMTISPISETKHNGDLKEVVTMRCTSTQVTPTSELEEIEAMNPCLLQTQGSLVLEDSDEETMSNKDQAKAKTKISRSTSPIRIEHIHPADMFLKPVSPERKPKLYEKETSRPDYFADSSSSATDEETEITELGEEDQALLEKLEQRKHASQQATRRAKDYANQLRDRTLIECSSSDESDDESSFEDDDYVGEGDVEESDSENFNEVIPHSDEEQPFHPTITEVVYKELRVTDESAVELANKLYNLEVGPKTVEISDRVKSNNITKPDSANLYLAWSPSSSETSDTTIIEGREAFFGKPTSLNVPSDHKSSTPVQLHSANSKSSRSTSEKELNILPVISEGSPKQRQSLPTFSDISFDSDYAEDEDFQALKASNERVDRLIQEFPNFEDDDYPDATEPELLALIDDNEDTEDGKGKSTPVAHHQPMSAPADISLAKLKTTGSPLRGIAVERTSQDGVPLDDSAKDEDVNALRLQLSPMSPVKAEWLLAGSESDDELVNEPQRGISHVNLISKNNVGHPHVQVRDRVEGRGQHQSMSMSSGVFTASHPLTDSLVSTNQSDDKDLQDIQDAYQNLLQVPDSSLDGRLSQVGAPPSNACTQTEVDAESVASQAASVVTHDMSSETERDFSWTSPELESLRDDKEFVYSKIGNTLERRDMSVELMEAQMMHGMGETDAFLKFLDSDLPVEDWYKARQAIQEQQRIFVKKQTQVTKQTTMQTHYSSKRQQTKSKRLKTPPLSKTVHVHSHSVSPRMFHTSADLELPPDRPSTLPPSSSSRTTPSQYLKFLQNLRQGIVAATAAQGAEQSDVQTLLEESQMMRANSRAEIARAEMDLNSHVPHNGVGGRNEDGKDNLPSARPHSAPVEYVNTKPLVMDNGVRTRFNEETEDAVDREIECLRAASAVINSSSNPVMETNYLQEARQRSMSAGTSSWSKDEANIFQKPGTFSHKRATSGNLKQQSPISSPASSSPSASPLHKPRQGTHHNQHVRTTLPLSHQWTYNRYPYNKFRSHTSKPLISTTPTHFRTQPGTQANDKMPSEHSQEDTAGPCKTDESIQEYKHSPSSFRSSPESIPSPLSGRNSPLDSDSSIHKRQTTPASNPRRRRSRTPSLEKLTPELPPLRETLANTSYSDFDYTGEQAVATLLTEMIQVGGFNPTNTSQPIEYGGWRLQGQQNDILLLQKTKYNHQIDSFMGVSLIRAPARTVFNLIQDVSQLKAVDPRLQDVEILENQPNRFKILHLLYTTEKCYLQKSRDVCVVFKAAKQLNKYVVAATSVQHKRCPDMEGVVRAKVLCCGIGLEAVNTPTGEHCKVTYLSQVDLKGELEPRLTNVIMKKQPLCIQNIKNQVENGQL